MLETKYNLSLAEYDEMLSAQDGSCAICRKVPKPDKCLAVDHDHVTGKVRGLLCGNCNRGIGYFRDSVYTTIRAAAYLEEHNTVKVLTLRMLKRLLGHLRK